ncbi:subtilisin-like serine protease pepD [Hypoxylon sp. EC38]|nr:subtilisin-like serine protease pepD [Hypoxylon sp. EC38]
MQHLRILGLGIFALVAPTLAGTVDPLDLQDGDVIPGKYIVSLKPEIDVKVHLDWVTGVHRRSLARCKTVGLEKTYGFGAFNGYAGEFDDDTIAQILSNENVLSVEQDRVARLTSVTQQTNAPWGLESLSSRSPLANGDLRGHTYSYDSTAGEGTFAYVLDSGVLTNNSEFSGRAIKGYNTWDTEPFEDNFGHGTHVAGTIASNTYGVAKKATIIDVKVVRGLGYSTVAHVIDGINWVVNNATGTPGRAAKSVINMSLAFSPSTALNNAVDAASAMGILSVVGAGNDNALASTRSPASASTSLTVGAVHWNRTRASFSNYGSCVDIFAPGVDVASLWNVEGVESVNSGTSMSSPHVAGLALYLKGLEDGLDSPADTVARIKELATPDVVVDAGIGSPNLLAYNGIA